ncbi:MAG: prepilin peptidase [Phycisphaerae bacterium]|jgi:leader peptidase (prepilin peptidase)/N-methyltransferase
MILPDWFWITFTFAFGACVGSFLNVVIYRLPREKSLATPGSFCPSCGKGIRFYDNIPMISYLLLGRKCRYCKARISPRYFVIELLTSAVFVFIYYLFFRSGLRAGIPYFTAGGWLLYLMIIILLSVLIAASAIDLELWIIPLWLCWFATIVGIIGSTAAPLAIDYRLIRGFHLFPHASTTTSALSLGGALGLGVSMILLATGIIKRSYDWEERPETGGEKENTEDRIQKTAGENERPATSDDERQKTEDQRPKTEPNINHRIEVLREVLFLLPVIAGAICVYLLTKRIAAIEQFWIRLLDKPMVAGFFGSVFAYFIGCAIVWTTRILGTLGFGREAMGLGDVHLMGAAGACIGAMPAGTAFFIAPFFGIGWAVVQMFFKKTRQIPYGPFLSLGIFVAIIMSDRIWGYLAPVLGNY